VVAFGLHHPDLGREYVVVAAELRPPIDDAAAEMFAEDALGKSSGPASKLDLLKHLAASRWCFVKASLGGRDGEGRLDRAPPALEQHEGPAPAREGIVRVRRIPRCRCHNR
jgi:hypothetical protein